MLTGVDQSSLALTETPSVFGRSCGAPDMAPAMITANGTAARRLGRDLDALRLVEIFADGSSVTCCVSSGLLSCAIRNGTIALAWLAMSLASGPARCATIVQHLLGQRIVVQADRGGIEGELLHEAEHRHALRRIVGGSGRRHLLLHLLDRLHESGV